MSTITLLATPLILTVLLAFGHCRRRPPVINNFTVTPTNQCATVPVAVSWAADAASGRITISPPTSPPPPDWLPSMEGGGLRFATASTDTTYTLTVERDGTTATQSRLVRIVPSLFVQTLEMRYDCADLSWNHPAFSEQEFGEVLTVDSITNMERQPLLLSFGGQLIDLPPRVPTPLISPVRLVLGPWKARLSGGGNPECGGGGGSTHNGPPPTMPPSVQIRVTSHCPPPR